MKRFLILTVLMIAMLFSCTTPEGCLAFGDNGNNTTQGGENTGGNTDTPAVKVTITFNANGAGDTVPATITTTSVETVDLPALANVKFSHWNTKADGSGLSYNGTATFSESVTLYAILLAENAYKITYELNGGVNNPQNSFSFTEDDYISLKNPSKDGYKFLGWYDNKNFSGNAIKGWAAGDKTADVTLYAKWEKEPEPAVKVTITFNANGAGGTVPTAIETTSVENVELPTLANAKFSHWNTKADGSGLSYNGSATFSESVTLYAILLAENAYTITYELNGGVNNPKNKFSFTEEDEMVALREPTKDGYTFAGWYETADFSGEAIKVWFEGDKTADVTLYAKWEKAAVPAVKVTITFNVNGAGGTAPAAITATADKAVDLPTLTIAKFSHWNTKADGSGLSYNGTATFSESVTLYAILLAENAYKITYELNGGVNDPANLFTFTENDFIVLKNPSKDGYKFLGWYDNKNFSGNAIEGWNGGDKPADVTLYAKWEKEPEPAVKVTITFNVNGAGGTTPTAIETTSVENVELPTLANAKFSHWNTKADGSGQSYNGTAIFTESVTLYAILLAENAYTITYELNGGVNNPKNKFSFTEEDEMVALREPTRDGYKFAGWYETADFSGEAIKIWYEGEKTANVTLYAKWEKDNSNSGNEPVEGGSGVYSYTLDIEDISGNWGGSTVSPAFSVVLLTDEGLEKCIAEANFKVNPAAEPEYQLGAFGNMKIKDTAEKGTFKVYGAHPVDDEFKYYNGVVATIDATTFTLFVDMSKVVITDLKALWEGDSEKVMTNEDIVDLTGYKPYVVALATAANDEANCKFNAWSADVMAMEEGATFPTELIEDAPKIPTCYDLNCIAGSMTGWDHTALVNNSFTFTATGGDAFEFTVGSWDFKAADALVTALDTEVSLSENGGMNITFANGVLSIGLEYIVTLIVKDKHEAYVKVEETGSKVTAISVNSTSHKTSYVIYESLDVSNLTIEVTRDDGTIKTSNVTSSMVSGFNPLELGTQTLTITYGGCTTTFDVEVHEIETETVEATASNVYDKISGLSSGYYLLKVSGEITSSTIANITSAMNYTSAKIILDLSETTGLASTGSGTSGSRAFWYCDNLISITLPDGLTSIGSDAFTGCGNLINVVIPESVTEIGHDAFKECSSLISTEIPYGVTTINEETFAYCCSLTSVTIPESVTYIDYNAFQQCSSLTTVNYRGTQEQWEQIVIDYGNTYLKNASVNYNYTGSVLGKVTGIAINSVSYKTSYNAGESLDVSGLTIEVTKEDATTKTVKVSSNMVSGFNSLELGTQTLTITYGGCTTTFDIEVIGTTYTIAFDANGGSGTMESLTVIGNIIYKLDEEPFTAPAGYVFNSWNTKADGSGKTYYMNNNYSFSNDMTLYAVWEKIENNFDVSLPGSTSFSIYQSTDGDNVTFECSSNWWFDSYTWYIDGVKQTSTSEEMTVDTSAMKAGIYTIMLKVKYNGTYWSETTTLTVNK